MKTYAVWCFTDNGRNIFQAATHLSYERAHELYESMERTGRSACLASDDHKQMQIGYAWKTVGGCLLLDGWQMWVRDYSRPNLWRHNEGGGGTA